VRLVVGIGIGVGDVVVSTGIKELARRGVVLLHAGFQGWVQRSGSRSARGGESGSVAPWEAFGRDGGLEG